MPNSGKTGPAIGILFLIFCGIAVIAHGLIKGITTFDGISRVAGGVMILLVTLLLSRTFFGRKSSLRKFPIMRQRIYGPSGDRKPVIHQKLPP